jgi:hypothetical protein
LDLFLEYGKIVMSKIITKIFRKLIGRTGRDLLGSIIGVFGFKTSALVYNDIE